ncbi:unnamed protein product [Mycena citricolor]|uniref:ATP-dependent DNA helicase II subunit 1 n=1 Tax=Mycena citricolor TaxID=2018698 RepID=A0AAD2HI37_9AGAR|nr:unnamed protein product [Mycena citricolor]
MAPYEDWNKLQDEDDDELQDFSQLDTKRDVILFCIDCSESMLALYPDPTRNDAPTCHVYTALDIALQLEKRKIIVGPNDAVGILLFNTTRKPDEASGIQGSEIKANCYLAQPIGPLSVERIHDLIQLLEGFRENPVQLKETYPPLTDGRKVPMGDVFTSCNWVIRDGAPKTASKRVFLITDEDDPHTGKGREQLTNSARNTLIDLTQSGANVEPFFISSKEKPFDLSKFYSSALMPDSLVDEEEMDPDNPTILPESISIYRAEELLDQMRVHEIPKRSQFSIPFQIAQGFVIGVKGYGLVTEQKKGQYKYFVDLGDRMEVAISRTQYVDQALENEIDKVKIVYGGDVGGDEATKTVKAGQRPFYSAEDIQSFRTLGLEPGMKLLGFKDRSELRFEDNIKHSLFIQPDEMAYSGSKRTFNAMLKSMIKKNKIGLVLSLTRRNSSPTFCALLPQAESKEDEEWKDPAGFHLIPLPFADDIREAPVDTAEWHASEDAQNAARAWIDKLTVKNGGYPPDSYPNPALAFHNAQLQAVALHEDFDPDTFENLTNPNHDMIHKDDAGDAEIRARHAEGTLMKLRVDDLKNFLKSKALASSGKKADLIERVEGYLSSN